MIASPVVLALAMTLTTMVATQPAAASPDAPARRQPAAVAIPAAGSVTASPATDITLRSVPAADIVVEGSRSGSHRGSVTPHPDGRGVTFRPDTPFRAGEIVTVTTDADVTGAVDGRYAFRVGVPADHPGVLANGELATPRTARAARDAEDVTAERIREQTAGEVAPAYVTRPDLNPPSVTINQAAVGTAPGLLMATPQVLGGNGTQAGSMIYDETGELVWFRPSPGNKVVGDLKRVTYQGQPALTWFEGVEGYGPGNYRGEFVVVDHTYSVLARVQMSNGYEADLHDILFTARGTVYLMAYNPLTCDNVSITGCRTGSTVLEAVLQEIDTETGIVLFEWHSLDHVPLADSYLSSETDVFDYIHPNSLDLDLDGNVLMSARHTSALYKINRSSGEVMFTFGGRSSAFTYAGEEYQAPTHRGPDFPHDFHVRPDGSYSYFDNGVLRAQGAGGATPVADSRGAIVDLDLAAGTATYTTLLHRNPVAYGPTQGRLQALPGDNELVTWGGLGIVTEFDDSYSPVFDATLGAGTYRQVRHEWSGAPTEAPALTVTSAGMQAEVSVSWNGDTRTEAWRLLAGSDPTSMTEVQTESRAGFETTFTTSAAGPFYAAEAVDSSGTTLRRSQTVRDGRWFAERPGPPVNGAYEPFVGDFGGSRNDDVFYYAPGTAPDYLHVSDGSGGFDTVLVPAIGGEFTPQVGDFLGDDRDEVLWWSSSSSRARLWRFDRNPRQTLDISPQGARLASMPRGTAIDPIVLDHRPMGGGGQDEILWYGTGSTADRVDRLAWNAGSVPTIVSRDIQVGGTYRTASGDFDGNGLADVLWHAPGSPADYLWLTTGGPAGSTGQLSVLKSISGTFQPIAGDFAGAGDADEVFLWASGPRTDRAWVFETDGSHTSIRAVSSLSGSVAPLRSQHDYAMIWDGASPDIWRLLERDAGHVSRYTASLNTAVPSDAIALIGDFVGAGGTDSVLWYRAGSGAERLYVGR